MTDAPMGHNGGPPLEEAAHKQTLRTRWAKALFADDETPAPVIAMCWAIHWYSKPDGSGAALSNEQFVAMCGVSLSAAKRGKKWLRNEGYVRIRPGDGITKTQFQMTIPPTREEKRRGITGDTLGAHPELPAQSDPVHSEPEGVHHGLPQVHHEPPGEVTVTPYIQERESRSIQEPIQECAVAPTTEVKTEVKSSPKTGAKSGTAFWQAAFAPKEPEPHEDVIFRNGEIILLNGARSEWLGQFQGEEAILDLALKEIAGEIQPNSTQPIKVQVVRKLAQMTRRRLEQDKRYAAAAASKGKPGGRTEDAAARRERIRQHAIDAAEAFERNRGRS